MRSRLFTLTLGLLLTALVAPPAFATHYDNTAATGSFNPQYTATFEGQPLVNRVGDLTIRLTQADHEDPAIWAELPLPGQWQFPMTTLRPGERPDTTTTTSCDDVVDGDGDGVIANQAVARAEIFGRAHAEVALSITRPGPPLVYDGDFVFIAWDPVGSRARLCAVIQSDDARINTAPLPPGVSVEDVAELRLAFWLPLTTDSQGNPVWAAPIDLRDFVKEDAVQALDISILEVLLEIFGRSNGNWHAGGADSSKAPATSGAYNFKGYFETCPANDPAYKLCKSGRGPVTRDNTINIGLPAPAVTSPADGAFITTHGTTITGTSDPNATVRIFSGATSLGDVTANGSGVWDTAGSISLAEGSYTITARTVDAGGQSPASNTRSFTINTPPAPPSITAPATATRVGQGPLTVAGTGQPGATVKIYDGLDVAGTTIAGPDGSWSRPVNMTVKGAHNLTATASDLGGEGDPSLPVAIDVTTATPVFTAPADDAHVASLTIDLAGTAEPGATVTVSKDGLPVGSPVADAGGVFTLPLTLPEGEHNFTAVSAKDGFVSLDSATHTLTIDITAPGAPAITAPADAGVVNVRSVPFGGTGEPGATLQLRSGGSPIGSTTVAEDGTWSKSIPLKDGLYTVEAIQTDRAGNGSTASAPVSFEVDVPVIIATPAQDSMNPKLTSIQVLGDVAATEARIYRNGLEIGRTTMKNGVANLKLNFTTGTHAITARTLSSGQLGKPSAVRTFQVDATAPTVDFTGLQTPTVSVALPGDLLSGTATDAGGAISGVASIEAVFTDERNVFVGKTTANCPSCPGASVSWSVVPSEVVGRPGVYNVSVTSKDAMGNVSAAKRTKILVTLPTL